MTKVTTSAISIMLNFLDPEYTGNKGCHDNAEDSLFFPPER